MNRRAMIVFLILLAGAGTMINAQAQEKTRAQVRHELIDAERNGLNFVSDTSYPEVAPVFEQQVARLKQEKSDSGMGSAMTGTSDAGHLKQETSPSDASTCVGPASFCTIYFGS
ncbi:DUF4148 domain-containing protein [Paraburkholderia sacchari]|uniref:DUF4148 domain-containing protein n=1 Tax=Paraburkholderia sacchari TaxID=159450 RepID=UPI0039A6ACD2